MVSDTNPSFSEATVPSCMWLAMWGGSLPGWLRYPASRQPLCPTSQLPRYKHASLRAGRLAVLQQLCIASFSNGANYHVSGAGIEREQHTKAASPVLVVPTSSKATRLGSARSRNQAANSKFNQHFCMPFSSATQLRPPQAVPHPMIDMMNEASA